MVALLTFFEARPQSFAFVLLALTIAIFLTFREAYQVEHTLSTHDIHTVISFLLLPCNIFCTCYNLLYKIMHPEPLLSFCSKSNLNSIHANNLRLNNSLNQILRSCLYFTGP